MEIFPWLGCENDIYKLKTQNKGYINFYVMFESKEMDFFIKKNQGKERIEDNILVKFICDIDKYPIYAYVLSHEKNTFISSISKSNVNEIALGYYLYKHKISNKNELYKYINLIYLDSFNGYSVVISTRKDIKIDYSNKEKCGLFIFEFPNATPKTYFLTLSHDGDGFDFIANFKNHPYKDKKIVNE